MSIRTMAGVAILVLSGTAAGADLVLTREGR